jgi:hypothetical protein
VALEQQAVYTELAHVVNIVNDTPAPLVVAQTMDDVGSPLPPQNLALPSAVVTVPLNIGAEAGGWAETRLERW